MGFYSLSKKDRLLLVNKMAKEIKDDFENKKSNGLVHYFSDNDTYIRKSAIWLRAKCMICTNLYDRNTRRFENLIDRR